jgi:peptidyl-tRNA hydrolase
MDADPLVMYLIAPRRPSAPGGELLAEAARATLLCVQRFERDPAWSAAFRAWERSSYRKVCLRARAAELDRARVLDHAECGEMLCLPPRRRTAAEPELATLQAHVGGPLRAVEAAADALPPGALLMLIAEDLELTLGKACAQVGHAILIARDRWRVGDVGDLSAPVAVRLAGRETFDRAGRELTVAAVRDAGFTQVAPGTATVLGIAPGAPVPDWLTAAAAQIA